MPDSLNLADAVDDDETFNPVANALAHADNISHPVVRSLFNYIATKISTLPEAKIRRLTDDELARLIKDESLRLSESDLNRLIDAEFIRLTAIADSLSRLFSDPNSKAENEKITITPPSANGFTGKDIVYGLIAYVFLSAVYQWYKAIKKVSSSFATKAAQERLRSPKRSSFLSIYSTSPDLKGLKGIGELYCQEFYRL